MVFHLTDHYLGGFRRTMIRGNILSIVFLTKKVTSYLSLFLQRCRNPRRKLFKLVYLMFITTIFQIYENLHRQKLIRIRGI